MGKATTLLSRNGLKNLSMFPMTQHMIGKSFIEYHGILQNAELCSIIRLEFL